MRLFSSKSILSLALGAACFLPIGVGAEEVKDAVPLTAAITWLQNSAEYEALCRQTYNVATQVLEEKMRTNDYVRVNGKLCEETFYQLEDGTYAKLYQPLAVVLDIDETVVDNSGIEAWCLLHKEPYNDLTWTGWCTYQGEVASACKEVPGAVDFLLFCQRVGITPIYITNRDESVREATYKALVNLGLGTPDLNERLILRDKPRDKKGAQDLVQKFHESADSVFGRYLAANRSDKAGRRTQVRTQYKVVGWFGDNLYDLPVMVPTDLPGGNREVLKVRDEQAKELTSKLGNTVFILPNPIYGSWLKPDTVPVTKMKEYLSDYGFNEWYQEHKEELRATSER